MLRAMSAVRRVVLTAAAVIALVGAPRRSAADPVSQGAQAVRDAQDLVEQARQLAATARDVRDLLYFLSDPRGFQYEMYRTYDEVLRDPVLGPLLQNLQSLYRQPIWTITARAQGMADSATPASIAAGATLAFDLPLCRVIELQGSAQGFYEDRDTSAALAYGVGGCLPLPFGTFELGYRGRRQVRTSLLALPIVDGERQSGDTIYSSLRFYRWLSKRHRIDVMPMSFNFDWARDGGTSFHTWSVVQPVSWARRGRGYRGRDQTYDFFRIAFSTLGLTSDGIADPLVATMSPLAIDGVRIGDHVALGLDLGQAFLEEDPDAVTVTNTRALHLDASIVAGGDPATVEVHLKHVAQPTILNQILDENRATVRLDVDRTAAWLRADGYVSHARLLGAERYSERVWTYGAGADLTVAITEHVFAYGRAEGARAIVVDATAATPDTALDVRGTIGLTTQYQKRWGERR